MCILFTALAIFFLGGHENFAKMIDEAEVLEFPMVVKNTRGHRGGCESLYMIVIVLNESCFVENV